MDKTLQQYDAVVAECLGLFTQKAKDYGTAWRILRVPSLTDQIFIKAQRIRTLQQVGESRVGEGIRPELIGIINYAAMALVQLDLGVVDAPDLDASAAAAEVRERLDRARDLMTRKNHDYGEAWRSMRVSSLVDLILMKLLRIKQIEDNQGNTLVSEGIDANFLDIVNYAVFAMIQMEEAGS
jgi:SLT domain-containing protein